MSYKLLNFVCDSCESEFEDLVWISEGKEDEVPKCPHCEEGHGTREGIQCIPVRHISWSSWNAGQ